MYSHAAKYDLRLVNGDWPGEGRLEVYDGKQWGTVCDDGFSNVEATVACRQLGYNEGVVVLSTLVSRTWGMGTGRILMNNVNCSEQPRSARLKQCKYQSWEDGSYIDCYHTEDVGIRCYGMFFQFTISIVANRVVYVRTFPGVGLTPWGLGGRADLPDVRRTYLQRRSSVTIAASATALYHSGPELYTNCRTAHTTNTLFLYTLESAFLLASCEVFLADSYYTMHLHVHSSRWANLAAGRPTYASSYLGGSAAVGYCENDQCLPSYATDGNTSSPLRTFRTDQGDINPWLSIDLGSPMMLVQRIVLFYRLDCCGDAMGGVELRVGNTSISRPSDVGLIRSNPLVWSEKDAGATGGVLDVSLRAPVAGRWLTLQNSRNTAYYMTRVLEVVELQAYGIDTSPFIPGAIAAGSFHTCVMSASPETLKCFGSNTFGQLGVGDLDNRGSQPGQMGSALPTVNLGPRRVVAVTAGCFHTCALLQPGGFVKCWGLNDVGQLGLGDTRNRGGLAWDMGSALPPVDLGPGLSATALAAGCNHTCAILQPGNIVKCWGLNTNGQLGLGDTRNRGGDSADMGAALPAVDLAGSGSNLTAAALSLGASHSCALMNPGGLVKCWGANMEGQLGLDDTLSRGDESGEMGAALKAVDLGRRANAVVTERSHVCVLLSTGGGNVKCWGSNSQGQLGLGDTENRGDGVDSTGNITKEISRDLPEVSLGRNFSASVLAVGEFHTCAILQPGGIVKCWGGNKSSQLGLGDKKARGDSAGEMGNSLPVVDLGPGLEATALAAGARHTCALLQPGNIVKCWGSNDYGALGLGDRSDRGQLPEDMGVNLPPVNL
ncbi:hypothetical protein VOLCADRAFT_92579 [Volvox carteri f. nagariensis]|uniref:SRCR domain-containing protein n=1 Tax=Volvox carteri f. nagariensis TaxID=3068 RepID=D8U011_VOLCA|nr:uncharacterized protein VOLCADRAFT_92579 [Volvox carteri f. nagariensis]EFJ46855.1 hypothetical protein VOLCADRAFT_92579 [Volvox carteri f. nagariensis]|eukprot:XP_002952064.1 hypothetical protein VOLCADRAFT_92579 [Volvox carteri f. nagariensis]